MIRTLTSLQQQVGDWQRRTFPGVDDRMRLAKLREEVAELIEAPSSAEEMADVLIVLLSIADAHGVDMIGEAFRKFEIVRSRDQAERDRGKGYE